MKNTEISWATHTFNPWRGCTKVSAGCANCYADTMSKRNPATLGIWGPNGTRVLASDAMWKEPLKWNREAEGAKERPRVFCASLADVFEDWDGEVLDHKGCAHYTRDGDPFDFVRNEQVIGCDTDGYHYTTLGDVRTRLFHLIDSTPNLDWLLLTKRPENIAKMWPDMAIRSGRQLLEEVRVQITGFPDYEISNLGIVYSLRGSNHCCFCGESISGVKQKKYCGQKCRQASHYCRSKGIADEFECEAKPLNGDIGEDGHTRVTLYKDGESSRFLVHRLVLTMFSGPSSPTDQGRHLDGNPRNNRIDNLEWGSQSKNWDDSKRHGTHRRYSKLTQLQVDQIKSEARMGETPSCLALKYDVSATQIYNILSGKQWKHHLPHRSNVFLGTTVENQEQANKRIPELLKCRDLSPVLFLSCEPLLGKVDLNITIPAKASIGDNDYGSYTFWNSLTGFRTHKCGGWTDNPPKAVDWVFAGGESGKDARPMHPDWARSLRDQCQAAGVAWHFKQWGEYCEPQQCGGCSGMEKCVAIHPDGRTFSGKETIPSGQGVSIQFKVGKKAAGRMLDGREWNEVPNVHK